MNEDKDITKKIKAELENEVMEETLKITTYQLNTIVTYLHFRGFKKKDIINYINKEIIIW